MRLDLKRSSRRIVHHAGFRRPHHSDSADDRAVEIARAAVAHDASDQFLLRPAWLTCATPVACSLDRTIVGIMRTAQIRPRNRIRRRANQIVFAGMCSAALGSR